MARENSIKHEIIEHLGCLGERSGAAGWTREVNMISWNGGPPKVDIRSWTEDHEKMSKGITLTQDEALLLAELLIAKCNY